MVMTAAKGPGKNLQKQIDASGSMCIDTAKMAASNIDRAPFTEGVPAGERVTCDLRSHQERAVDPPRRAVRARADGPEQRSHVLARRLLGLEGVAQG